MTWWLRILLTLAVLALVAPVCLAEEDSEAPEPFISVTGSDFVDWCDDTMCIMPSVEVYYNRVDGLLLYVGARYLNDMHLHPRLRAVYGWTSARAEGYYQIEFEQPFHSQDSFSLGVSLYEKTAWSREDDEAVTDLGNNIRAMMAHDDQRNYFRRDGVTLFAQHKATPHLTMRLEYRSDAFSSLKTQQSVWSVFNNHDDWRENPPLEVGIQDAAREFEGRMNSYYGSVVHDSRDEYTGEGWRARAFLEFSGGSVGGDYDFRKYVIDLERDFCLTETQTLDLVASWGIGSGTCFPSHKLFYLGGLGNLRGYELNTFSGKNMMFGRAEYGVQAWRSLQMIYFVESGAVWYSGGEVSRDFHTDFGIGFRFDTPGVGDIRLNVARPVTTEEADIIVSFRLYY